MTERFTYEIRPHTPIRELIPGRMLNKPTTTQLTKEEVLICMKHGPVYRIFPGKAPIRVLGANIDELHTPNGVASKNIDKEANYTENVENRTRAQEGVSNEPKTDAIREEISVENTVDTETQVSEESVEVEEVTTEKEQVQEEVEDNIEDTSVEESIEEEVEEEVEDELIIDDTDEDTETESVEGKPANQINVKYNNNSYRKKKKH